MGRILVGTASWTDSSLIDSGWYPTGVSSAEDRLGFYASRFQLVEVDSTYYFLPRLHRRQHAAMHHRTWINALGNIAYAGELPPELGIPFKNQLDAETDRLWLKAYQDAKQQDSVDRQDLAGVADPVDQRANCTGSGGSSHAGSGGTRGIRRSALAAQAFLRMIENGGGKGKTNRADMVIVCDLRAYRRGHAHEDEPCHIIGGGPIPVTLAKELGRDAFVKAVLHTGTEIHTIAHFGRRWPAIVRTALDLGAPPDFNGNVCAAPGCDRTYHLQDDHIDPVANGGPTAYANRQPMCPTDHRIKTEQDRKAGLLHPRKKPGGPDPKRAGPNRDRTRPRLL